MACCSQSVKPQWTHVRYQALFQLWSQKEYGQAPQTEFRSIDSMDSLVDQFCCTCVLVFSHQALDEEVAVFLLVGK